MSNNQNHTKNAGRLCAGAVWSVFLSRNGRSIKITFAKPNAAKTDIHSGNTTDIKEETT